MPNLKELSDKTGIVVKGIVWGKNVFIPEDTKDHKEYHSVDLMVKGHKNVVTIKLPEGYDSTKILEGEIFTVAVQIKLFNGKTSMVAL